MRLRTIMLAGALLGASLAASAQPLYSQPYGYYPPPAAASSPPLSWYYNPYTSGLGPCPQRLPHEPPCRDQMPPSYGQPNFWPRMP